MSFPVSKRTCMKNLQIVLITSSKEFMKTIFKCCIGKTYMTYTLNL